MHDDIPDALMLIPLWETEHGHRTRYGEEVDLTTDRLDEATVSALQDAALALVPDEEISGETLRELRDRLRPPRPSKSPGG